MGRGWELLLTNMPETPLQEGRGGEGAEDKNVFPRRNLSGCGVKAVSPTGAFGCSCRALVALVSHRHPHNRDAVPTGPACHSGPWFSGVLLLTDSLLGVPCPSQQLFWKSPCKKTLDPGRWFSMATTGSWETHICHPCLVGMQCGPKPQILHCGHSPLCPSDFSSKRPPTIYHPLSAEDSQKLSLKLLKCILDAPLISLEVSKRHKGLKFSNIQLLLASTMAIYSYQSMREHRSSPTQGYSSISSWNIWSIQS